MEFDVVGFGRESDCIRAIYELRDDKPGVTVENQSIKIAEGYRGNVTGFGLASKYFAGKLSIFLGVSFDYG